MLLPTPPTPITTSKILKCFHNKNHTSLNAGHKFFSISSVNVCMCMQYPTTRCAWLIQIILLFSWYRTSIWVNQKCGVSFLKSGHPHYYEERKKTWLEYKECFVFVLFFSQTSLWVFLQSFHSHTHTHTNLLIYLKTPTPTTSTLVFILSLVSGTVASDSHFKATAKLNKRMLG